jgi:hypothetical protein
MMKTLMLFVALTAPVFAGIIPISGEGNYVWYASYGRYWMFTATGQTDTESFYLFVQDGTEYTPPTFPGLPTTLANGFCSAYIGASIDGVGFQDNCGFPNVIWYNVGGGGGYLNIFDWHWPFGAALMAVEMNTFLQYSNVQYYYQGGSLVEVTANLNISGSATTPLPEPTGGVALGLILLSSSLFLRSIRAGRAFKGRGRLGGFFHVAGI